MNRTEQQQNMTAYLRAHHPQMADKLRVQYEERVTSTNTILFEKGLLGEQEGLILIADEQTAGKGRRGRSFYSPEYTGIYFSMLLKPAFSLEDALLITTAAAVAVVDAIEKTSGKQAAIKWVNDVFLDGKKICGILAEASAPASECPSEGEEGPFIVLGIGINLNEPRDGCPAELSNRMGFLFGRQPCTPKTRIRLVREVWDRFLTIYEKLPDREFMNLYKRHSFVIGREVVLLSGNQKEQVFVEDMDERARLLVRKKDGTRQVVSTGEISLRIPGIYE